MDIAIHRRSLNCASLADLSAGGLGYRDHPRLARDFLATIRKPPQPGTSWRDQQIQPSAIGELEWFRAGLCLADRNVSERHVVGIASLVGGVDTNIDTNTFSGLRHTLRMATKMSP